MYFRLSVGKRYLAAVAFVLVILLPVLLYLSAPARTAAQETSGPMIPGGLSPRERLMYIASRSPAMAGMIDRMRLLEKTPASASLQELQEPLAEQGSPVVYYWRYVHAYCFVKASSFAPQKVDWYWWGWPDDPIEIDYMGDCHFYIEYGAEYVGDFGGYVGMPESKMITDQWKKGMKFNTSPVDIKAPYYWLGGWNWDCSVEGDCDVPDPGEFTSCNLPDPAGNYDGSTGIFTTKIGPTGADHWRCGYSMEILTNSGADLSVFSPKPGVTHSIIDLTTNKKTTEQIGGTPYELWIYMKGFGIKSPDLPKQSGWDYVNWWLEAVPWHARTNTGMWLDHTDPAWLRGDWSGPYVTEPDNYNACFDEYGDYGCWGGATWAHHNPAWWWSGTDYGPIRLPPSTPKALFQPSSISVTYVKSDAIVDKNWWWEGRDPQAGFLYDFGLWMGYMHKRISFITGDEISFSGNPTNVRATHYGWSMRSDLQLFGAYPDFTYY